MEKLNFVFISMLPDLLNTIWQTTVKPISKIIGFSPFTIYLKGTLDILIIDNKNIAAKTYASGFLNTNKSDIFLLLGLIGVGVYLGITFSLEICLLYVSSLLIFSSLVSSISDKKEEKRQQNNNRYY